MCEVWRELEQVGPLGSPQHALGLEEPKGRFISERLSQLIDQICSCPALPDMNMVCSGQTSSMLSRSMCSVYLSHLLVFLVLFYSLLTRTTA